MKVRLTQEEFLNQNGKIIEIISMQQHHKDLYIKQEYEKSHLEVVTFENQKQFVKKIKDVHSNFKILCELISMRIAQKVFHLNTPYNFIVESDNQYELWLEYIKPTFDISQFSIEYVFSKMRDTVRANILLFYLITGNWDIGVRNMIPTSKKSDRAWEVYVIDFEHAYCNSSYLQKFGEPLFLQCLDHPNLPNEFSIEFGTIREISQRYDLDLSQNLIRQLENKEIVICSQSLFCPCDNWLSSVFYSYITPQHVENLFKNLKKDVFSNIIADVVQYFPKYYGYGDHYLDFIFERIRLIKESRE